MKRKLEAGALIEHAYDRPVRDTSAFRQCGTARMHCRVLVSKERLEQKWPTEKDGPEGEAFRKFAARLADAVQKALADGFTIHSAIGCCWAKSRVCPMGCLPDSRERRRSSPVYDIQGVADRASAEFAIGFDGHDALYSPDSPYYRLGQAYRSRFVRP